MKSLSQPVIIIERLLRDKPDRFRFSLEYRDWHRVIQFTDIITHKQMQVHEYPYLGSKGVFIGSQYDWMSDYEKIWLADIIIDTYYSKTSLERKSKEELERGRWLKAYEDDLNQKQRPKIIDAPRLDISIESLEGLRLKSKVKEQGFEIPYPYTLADVEWVNTSVWYKPWTWGEGYLKLKGDFI